MLRQGRRCQDAAAGRTRRPSKATATTFFRAGHEFRNVRLAELERGDDYDA